MVNAKNRSIERSRSQLYSMTAAADILKLQPQDIRKVEVWANVVHVKIFHRLSKFVSMKDFKKSFVERRKKAAEGLQVIPAPMVGGFVVKNCGSMHPEGNRNTQYTVIPNKNGIYCNCPDYEQQIQSNQQNLGTKHACCKHIYATLNHLGYGSLKTYINTQAS